MTDTIAGFEIDIQDPNTPVLYAANSTITITLFAVLNAARLIKSKGGNENGVLFRACLCGFFIVGSLAYFIGECNGYHMGLDDLGYELNGEGQIAKKEAPDEHLFYSEPSESN